MKVDELLIENIKPKFIKDPTDSSRIDIELDGKNVGYISASAKGDFNVRLGTKGRAWIRTLTNAKKWAEAVLNNNKDKLPPGTNWPT